MLEKLIPFIPHIVVMIICVILSAYFSATETAFLSFNKTRMKTMAEDGNKKAALVLRLFDNYDKLISTILIGNNIVNIGLSSLGTLVFCTLILNQEIAAAVSTAVCTVVVLIFGEITPKNIAKDCPEKFVLFSAPIINVIKIVLTPFNILFSLWRKLVAKIFRLQRDDKMSQEELLMFVEEVKQDGSINDEEGDLLKNAIEFTDRRAEEILTHRVDLEAVSVDAEKSEIAKVFSESKFSRLLVYEENIDNIIGVLHLRDFYVGGGVTHRKIKDVMAHPIFIHKSEKIIAILKKLQAEKAHIAVVVDEYGGTLGIVTMEDILEELVGDIWDEHDEVVETFREVGENTHVVDCSVNFEEFCEFYGIKSESDSVSLGGWITEQLERIPSKGDILEFESLHFTVTQADEHRAILVQVIRKESEGEESGKEE